MPAAPIIGIIGFGFSGLMVTANLLRETARPLTLYIIDPKLDARGAAYGTHDVQHLLNVQAARMGAWADAPEGFFQWLQTNEGIAACAQHGLAPINDPTCYAPRVIYGEYLQSIWQETQTIAAQKNCALKLVQTTAVAINSQDDGLAIYTERGDAIAVQHAVLCTGNEEKQPFLHVPQEKMLHRPWENAALDNAAKTASSIALIGTGLTAVDTILSLRKLGYEGVIHAFSRHGALPQPHAAQLHTISFSAKDVKQHSENLVSLLDWLQHLRREKAYDWREIVDALRPHTQTIWRQFSLADKERFLRHLAHRWGNVRHRLAPEIYATLMDEIGRGKLRIAASQHLHAAMHENRVKLTWQEGTVAREQIADLLINCTGVELSIARSKNTLMQQLLAAQYIQPHATHLGISADPHYRALGLLHPKLYAMGALLTGQCFESIAVPELREQAICIAHAILG